MKKTSIATLVAAVLVTGLALTAAPVAAGPPPGQYAVQVAGDELDANPASNLADLSLREAFQLASADGQDSGIFLQAGVTYELTRCGPADAQEDLNVDGDLDGPRGADGNITVVGQGATIRQTCPGERILHHIDDHRLVLEQLTLTGGDAPADGALADSGGAVLVSLAGAQLQLHGVTVAESSAFVGGGVFSAGDLEVDDSTFTGNEATFAASAIATEVDTASLVIRRSTISHNRTGGFGGAIFASGPSVLHDSTVVANSVTNPATANIEGGGEWVSRGSIVAAGSGGPDCGPGVQITGDVANIDSDGTCFPTGQHAGLHPQLSPLADNGGPTETHRPVINSPALDVIPEAQCLYLGDQRGEPRPDRAGGSCDLGSVEEPAAGCSPSTFPDVPGDHPFAGDVCWMAHAGITTGFADGGFHPSASVTRQSMAAFLYRFAMSPPFDPPATRSFSDVGANHPFLREIEWLVANEIATGFGDGTYRGGAAVSRQAMAAFLARIGTGEGGVPAPTTGPSYTDVGAGHPFYDEIEWVSAKGVSQGYDDDTWRPSAPVTRQAMSAFLRRLGAVPMLAGL